MEEILFVLIRRGLQRIHWNTQRERCPFALVAAGVNSPAMMMDDEVAGHQMDAILDRAIGTHHKGVENQAQGFLGQAGPIVSNFNINMMFVG